MRIQRLLLLAVGLCFLPAMEPANSAGLNELKAQFKRPASIPNSRFNSSSPAKVRLGKVLFFDLRLSGSNTTVCAHCHNPDLGWEDGLARGVGAAGEPLDLRTPTILNLVSVPRLA